MGKDAAEFRRKHGRLRKGWKKILEEERVLASPKHPLNRLMREFKLSKLPTPEEAATFRRLGRKLSEMGAKGIKVTSSKVTHTGKPVIARFVPGGLPSLGKKS